MTKKLVYAVCVVLILCGIGCAKFKNKVAADGGLIGSYPGDYIVRNDSGGKIMDVWKLRNVIVQSETASDGWLFKDQNDNVVHLGGDVKIIRISEKDPNIWESYIEYHTELETVSYQEKLAAVRKQ